MSESRLGDLVNGRLFRRELGVIGIGRNKHLTDELSDLIHFCRIFYRDKYNEIIGIITGGLSADSFCCILIDDYFGK